ncbi:MAG: porin [Planctomycetes bacterium]|nr:porin [Planctomycetota bacterium]
MSCKTISMTVALLVLVAGTARAAETTPSMDEVLARMAAMEKKIATQEHEIGKLKGQLRTKEAAVQYMNASFSEAEVPVQEAAAATARFEPNGFYHDTELHKRMIQMGGYIDTTYQYNFNKPDDRSSAFRVFDGEDDGGFDLHLAKIFFDGTAQEPGQAGFRIDLAMGTDARKIASFDRSSTDDLTGPFVLDDPDGSVALTGDETIVLGANRVDRLFDVEQAYIDYIAPVGNGVHFSFGKFVTPFGYEVIEAQSNFNATRSFNFGWAIPFTHTGMRVEYEFTDTFSASAYIVNGWDTLQDNNRGKTGILHTSWSPTKWFNWVVNLAAGCEGAENDSNVRYLANTSMTFTPWEKWTFGLEGNYGWEKDAGINLRNVDLAAGTSRGHENGEWYGAVGYVKWDFAERWYLAARGEFLRDLEGSRFGVPMNLHSITATAGWHLAEPLEIRFEYRHDGSSGNPFGDSESPATTNAFGDFAGFAPDRAGRSTQDTFTIQWLYKF